MRILPIALLCLGVAAGWFAHAERERVVGWTPFRKSQRLAAYEARRMTDVSQRQEVACAPNADVILVLGQSNAANDVGERFVSERGATDWLDGKCYRSTGGTLGSEGPSGSVWPLVGDLLLQAHPQRPVQFVGFAFRGSSSREWADRDALGGLLAQRLASLQAQGVAVTRVVWHQGEADVGMPAAMYVSNLRSVIEQVHRSFPAARFFVAQTSVCFDQPSQPALLAAQQSLVDGRLVRAGPNTDLIAGFEDRYDGCHFSGSGARRLAAAWAGRLLDAERD